MLKNLKICVLLQLRLMRGKLLALAGMALAALLLGAAGAAAAQGLLVGRNFTGVTIALASEEENPLIDQAVELLAGMQDISSFATIERTTAQQAVALVRDGHATAAIILPQGFLHSTQTGENLPPTLVLDTSRPLEAAMVVSLGESAVRLLGSAQQGVQLVLQVYDAVDGRAIPRPEVVLGANLTYASWVLQRSDLFREYRADVPGALDLAPHYLLGAVLFFAFLALPVLHPLYALRAQAGWLGRLRAAGMPLWANTVAQVLAGAAAIAAMLCLALGGVAVMLGGLAFSPSALLAVLLVALCFSCAGWLLCNTGGVMAAGGLSFLLAVAMLLCAGGVVPLVLLPAPVAALAPFSPFGWMHTALAPLFGAAGGFGALWPLAALLVLLAAAVGLASRVASR